MQASNNYSPRSALAQSFEGFSISSPASPKQAPRRSTRHTPTPTPTPRASLAIQIEQCQSFADFNRLFSHKRQGCSAEDLVKFLENTSTFRNLPHCAPAICQEVTGRCSELTPHLPRVLAAISKLKNSYPEFDTLSLMRLFVKEVTAQRLATLSGPEIVQIASAINSFDLENCYEPLDKPILHELVNKKKLAVCSTTQLADIAYVYRNYGQYKSLFNAIAQQLAGKACSGAELAILSFALRFAEGAAKEAFYQSAEQQLVAQNRLQEVTHLDDLLWIAQGFSLGSTFQEPLAGLVRSKLTAPYHHTRSLLADASSSDLVALAAAYRPIRCPDFYRALEAELCRFHKIQKCSGPEIASLACSFTTAGAIQRHLKDAIAHELCTTSKLEALSLQELENVAISMDGYAFELYERIERAILKDPSFLRCSAQSLVAFADAFNASTYNAEALYRAIHDLLISKQLVSTLTSGQLVKLANAYRCDIDIYKDLFEAIRTRLLLPDMLSSRAISIRELAELVHIFKKDENTRLHQACRVLLLDQNGALVKSLDRVMLARLLEGYSHTPAASRELFGAFEARILELVDAGAQFSLIDLSMYLHGFARSGFGSDHLFDTLENVTWRHLSTLTQEQLVEQRKAVTLLAWSLACRGRAGSKLFEYFSCCAKPPFDLQSIEIVQLAQIALTIRLENPQSYQTLISSEIETAIQRHKEAIRFCPPDSSKLHLEIASYIARAGVRVENEKSLEGLIVDIWIPAKNNAIEVNGPTHYVQDGKELNGVSRFKRRLVQKITRNTKPFVIISGPEWKSAKQINPNPKSFISTIIDKL